MRSFRRRNVRKLKNRETASVKVSPEKRKQHVAPELTAPAVSPQFMTSYESNLIMGGRTIQAICTINPGQETHRSDAGVPVCDVINQWGDHMLTFQQIFN